MLFAGISLVIGFTSYAILFQLIPVYFQRYKKRRSRVIAAVLTLAASAIMSFIFVTSEPSLIHTRHTFELIPTGQKNEQSSGADVVLFEIKDANDEIIPFEKLDPNSTWERREYEGLNALVAVDNQSEPIVYPFYGSENDAIQILFKSTAASGIVLIRLDTDEQVIDLFDQDEGDTILSLQVDFSYRVKTVFLLVYFCSFLFLLLCFWGLWIIIDLKTNNSLTNASRNLLVFVQNSFSGKYQLSEQITDVAPTPNTRGMLIALAVLLSASLLLIFRFQNMIIYPNFHDEYSYMFSYEYPLKFFVGIAYGYLMPALVFWTRPDLLTYRLVSFTLDLTLVAALTLTTIKWTEKWSKKGIQNGQKRLLIVFGFTAVMVKYSYMRLTPGYVDLANWATLIVALTLLSVLNSQSQRTALFLMGISGLSVGFGFFAKQPTSIALAAVVFVAIPIIFIESRRGKMLGVQLLGVFAASAALALLLFFIFGMPLPVWLEQTNSALTDHPPAGYLGRYWREIKNLFTVYLVGFYPIFGVAFLVSLMHTLFSRIWIVKLISRLLIFSAAAVPVILLSLDHFWYERSGFTYLQHITAWLGNRVGDEYFYLFSVIFTRGTIAYIAFGMVLVGYILGIAIKLQKTTGQNGFFRSIWERREVWVIIFAFLLFPFAPVSGSSEPLLYYARQSAWTWVMLSIIVYSLFHPGFNRFGNWLFVVLPSILIFTPFISAVVQLNNYHNNLLDTPMVRMESLPKGDHLLFPEPAAQVLEDSYSILVQQGGFSPGDTVFTYSPPYITYFLGGVPPGGHTHWHPYFFSQGLNNCSLIQRGSNELQEGAFIIEGYGGMPDEIVDCLSTMGIAFPQDFVEIGSLTEPYTDDEIVFYAPRNQ